MTPQASPTRRWWHLTAGAVGGLAILLGGIATLGILAGLRSYQNLAWGFVSGLLATSVVGYVARVRDSRLQLRWIIILSTLIGGIIGLVVSPGDVVGTFEPPLWVAYSVSGIMHGLLYGVFYAMAVFGYQGGTGSSETAE